MSSIISFGGLFTVHPPYTQIGILFHNEPPLSLLYLLQRHRRWISKNLVAYLFVKFLILGEFIISHNPLKINNSFKRINNWTIPHKLNESGIKWTICILRLKTKWLARTKTLPEIFAIIMKSYFAGWNPNEFGWNLWCATSDEIKSAFP